MYLGSFLTFADLELAVFQPQHGDIAFVGLLTKSYNASTSSWGDAAVLTIEDYADDSAAVEAYCLDAGDADTGNVCVGDPSLGNSSFTTLIDQGLI